MSHEHLIGKVFRVESHQGFSSGDVVYISGTTKEKAIVTDPYGNDDRRVGAKFFGDPRRFTPLSFEPVVRGSRFLLTKGPSRDGGIVREIVTVLGPANGVIGGLYEPFFDCHVIRERPKWGSLAEFVPGETEVDRLPFKSTFNLLKLLDPRRYERLPNATFPKPGRIIERKPRDMVPKLRQSSVRIKGRDAIVAGIVEGLNRLTPQDRHKVLLNLLMSGNPSITIGGGMWSGYMSRCSFEDRRPESAR